MPWRWTFDGRQVPVDGPRLTERFMANQKIKNLRTFFGALALTALVGCGGSGGSESPPEGTPAPGVSEVCPAPKLARITIDTQDAQPVVSKINYVPAQFVIESGDGGLHDVVLPAKIRGRGNSTWRLPKKPYLVKLDESSPLLGMPAGKKWVLLANHADKSLLRNAVAFCMARLLEMPYTSHDRFFELTMNGEYQGVYQLTNKDYEIRDLINKQAKTYFEQFVEGSDFDDPFVMELDERLGEDFKFRSNSGVPYTFESDTNAAQQARVQRWINEFEEVLKNHEDPDRMVKIKNRMDLNSLANMYLVNELMGNQDAFLFSVYLYRQRGGKLVYGPVWDFDLSLGNVGLVDSRNPEGWHARNTQWNWYFRELLKDPEFSSLMRQRWSRLARAVPSLNAYIDYSATALDAAQARNFSRWQILNDYVWPYAEVIGTYAGEVAFMKDWLNKRAHWINEHVDELK